MTAPRSMSVLRKLRQAAWVIVLAGGLAGCGGEDGAPQAAGSEPRVVIRGVVTDDPVVGATVTVTSLADQSTLATVKTGQDGSFETPSLAPSTVASGYLLSASGGTSVGRPFEGTLQAVYSRPEDYQQSNVTVLTTALVTAAKSQSPDPSTLAKQVSTLANEAVASGLYPSGFETVSIAERYTANASGDIVRWGLPEFMNKLASDLSYTLPASSSATTCEVDGEERRCSAIFNETGGNLYDQSGTGIGNVIVEVPPVLQGCSARVTARISDADNSIKVWYSISSGGGTNATCASTSQFLGAIRIILPPGTPDRVSSDCLAESHPAMPQCLTRAAGISPAYFVNDGATNRIAQAFHTTTKPAPNALTLSREFGSNLKRETVAGTHPQSAAVLFVNGYTFLGEFGGAEGTWGRMPNLVGALLLPATAPVSGLTAYNFQWRTNASFLDAARDLSRAIRYAYEQSNNQPVHIVAHSFGGLLVRVVLQGLATDLSADETARMVASITTLGTPHSGIQDRTGTVGDVELPDGWVLGPDHPCMQISCYQAGLDAGIPGWAKEYLRENGDIPSPGYLTARLRKGLTSTNGVDQLLTRANFQVLIGQFTNSETLPRTYANGDRLITYDGQRFVPEAGVSRTDLLFQRRYGETVVTERVLGLKVGVSGRPGSDYVIGDGSDYFVSRGFAYVHTAFLVSFIPSTVGPAREAEVDSTCVDPTSCMHDSWVNVRELLISYFGGSASPNFPLPPEPPNPQARVLNDTGITADQCYQGGNNFLVSCTSATAIALNDKQDGMVGRDVTANDSSDGKAGFSFSLVTRAGGGFYDKTECVKDNVTGLMWEGKTNDGGLRDGSRRYTNYGDGRGGDAGAYVAAVNGAGLCGYNDWRLPGRDELQGIVDYGVSWPGPAIDADWFPNTFGFDHWTSSPLWFSPSDVWGVDFANGAVSHKLRSGIGHVRLVR